VIGTSFIGLEAASALVQKGHEVTVVGRDKLPFHKQLGSEIAGALMKLHQVKGTRFRLGVEIADISAHGATVQEGVTRTLVPAGIVIMGVGVSPDLGFSHDLPIAQNGGGVRTDASLRAASSVWAAGDIASLNGSRIEHWRVAQQHGRLAALNMLNKGAEYEGVPFFWTYHFGKRVGYLGHATEWEETVIRGDLEAMEFIALLVRDSDVKAVVNCGFETQTAALAELMRGPLPLSRALQATQLD
jgi:NADPH-dependent 2,4-dienoyl-CoA reductase/sulfur reductase-like enzyme